MKRLSLPTRANPWGVFKTIGQAVTCQKRSLIKYVEFNITGRCQAGCITCPLPQSYPDEKKIKSIDDLKREFELFKTFFVKLKKYGLKLVTIYGREPLLWDKESGKCNEFLKKMIVWLSRDLGVRVCLATSGICLEESVVKVLFDQNGILFMKDWGSKSSVERLIKRKGAYRLIRQGWDLVKKARKAYPKAKVIAEFLYTGINRKDLLGFWKTCYKNKFTPFVEVPVFKGSCAKNYRQLKIVPGQYTRDIYELSLLNLSLRYGLSRQEAKAADLWQPPFGSVFPSPCDKLTRGQGVFLERDGNLSVCCGVNESLGNIQDNDIKGKLQNSPLLKRIRLTYEYLEGSCAKCDYSKKLHLCYGCRGNAYTYQSKLCGPFAPDPMCFGKIAYGLAIQEKLKGFMSRRHIEKILRYFKN
jgi:MoaA/NifB/PqqE/SkfB family radical SAM enzyme